MADIVLERRGSNLRYKTEKLQVSVPAPAQSIIYDQCGIPIAKKVTGSFQISGRVDCFQNVSEILRVSYRYFYNLDILDLTALGTDLNGAGAAGPAQPPEGLFVPNPPGFIRVRTNFLGNPRLPLETSIDGSNYALKDPCNVIIGTVEDKNLQKYGYDAATCKALTRYGYSTTVARHSSITDGAVAANIELLTGFALVQQTVEKPAVSNQEAMLTAWGALAGQNITLVIGSFEPTP